MNFKRTLPRLMLVSMLATIFIIVSAAAQPYVSTRSAHVDEHWFTIIIDATAYQTALLTHDIDMGGVPLPEYLQPLRDEGFTITTTKRLGYTFTMESARNWPFGGVSWVDEYGRLCGYGTPDDPYAENATFFRKALHRLIDKPECVKIYTPLMSACNYYLPEGAAYWINPSAPGATFNPGDSPNDVYEPGVCETASAYLNEGGFTPGSDANTYVDADTSASYYCPTLRIDPRTQDTMDEFEYLAIGPIESPLGYEMAKKITAWFHTAGVPCNLVAGTWLEVVVERLCDMDFYDYQLMTGVGIVWGSPAPDILYDFTYSANIPLWNFVHQNSSVADAAGIAMMTTLDLDECRQAAFDIQSYLADYEPYMPLMHWEDFMAETGPHGDSEGLIGIVNFKGRNPHSSSNPWGKMLTRADRVDPARTWVDINKWGLGAYLDTLNPLTADTVPDWQCLTNIMEGFYSRNPYTLEYMWWGVEDMPTIEKWIGPGGSHIYGGEDGCEATYDAAFNGTHYDEIPIDDVTADDLEGDDKLGIVTTWTLKEGMYWHDSDPGPDMTFGTTDDGAVHPVTTADAEFGFNLLRYQENVRYMTQWQYVYAVEPVTARELKIYEERRFLFAFEGHDVCMLAPKHIWEDFIFVEDPPPGGPYPPAPSAVRNDYLTLTRPDGSTGAADCWYYWDDENEPGTYYDNHHNTWTEYETRYMVDPTDPYDRYLTYLIGYGPFKYHEGGWDPGVSVKFETNPVYFAGHICPADLTFNQLAEPASEDVNDILKSVGFYPAENFIIRADTCYPAQAVELSEVMKFIRHSGHYWGPDPVPEGFERCTDLDSD